MFQKLQSILSARGMGKRLMKGGAVLAGASMTEQAFRFVRTAILTRILAPEDMGLMALILAVSGLFQMLTGVGIKESIVQHPAGRERTYLNAAWCVAICRALLLYAVMWFSAPAISAFYKNPALLAPLRVAFSYVLFASLISPRAYVALKDLRYPQWAAMLHGGGVLGVVCTVFFAWRLGSVWGLVIGYVAEAVFRCALSHILFPCMLGFEFSREHWTSILRYARGIFGLPILMYVYTEGATFVMGKLSTAAEIGIFAVTLSLARVPNMLGNLLVDLLMPAFSEIQSDKERLNRSLLKITSLVLSVTLPALGLLALCGGQLLEVAYGPKYRVGGTILAILFANEILITCNTPLASVYLALGKPGLLRTFSLVRAMVLAVILAPAVKSFGLIGAACAPMIAMLMAYGLQLHRMRTVTGLSMREYFGVVGRAALSLTPLALPWLGRQWMGSAQPVMMLMAVGGLGAMAYLVAAWFFFRYPTVRARVWPFAA